MVLKGFQFIIGEQTSYLTIENVDKSECITIIESSGKRYDLSEDQFIMLADRMNLEADKLKKKKAKREPKVTINFGDEEDKPKLKTNKIKKLEVR